MQHNRHDMATQQAQAQHHSHSQPQQPAAHMAQSQQLDVQQQHHRPQQQLHHQSQQILHSQHNPQPLHQQPQPQHLQQLQQHSQALPQQQHQPLAYLPQHQQPPPPPGMHYAMMNGAAQHHPNQHPHPQSQSPMPQHAPPPQQFAAHHTAYAPIPPQYHHHIPPYPPPNGMATPPIPSTMGANGMRYAIPQPPMHATHLGGGRHKKEIKRRTKTGCLTCRQRRIKCDEGQPECRNCQKSKRQCLGYDPVFKPQSATSSPASLQPASVPPPRSSVVNTPIAAPSAPPQNQYQSPRSFAPASVENFIPSAPPVSNPPIDYIPPLDPALASGDPSPAMPPAMSPANFNPMLQPERPVKIINIEQLYALNDTQPQFQKRESLVSPSPEMKQEISDFLHFHYLPGLNVLFETNWYTSQALAHIPHDAQLQDFISQCVELMKTPSNNVLNLEARLVWSLARLPKTAVERGAQRDVQLQELLPRIDIVENLLTGGFIRPDSMAPPPQPTAPAPVRDSQTFWCQLGHFVFTRDDLPDSENQINAALAPLRQMLGRAENRDVLYSIAVARHVGGRLPSFHPTRRINATSNDANDSLNQLKVAHHFIEAENQRGTTQVIQRICGMALRSWALAKQ